MSSQPLKGQVAIITGASRGIGREVALTLARAGAKVTIAAKSTQESANLPGTIFSVAKEIEALGGAALPVSCDVRKEEDIENVVRSTINKWGRIDICINNAGALWWKKMTETPMKRYDLINEVNSRATFALTSKCLPYMLKQKHGHIINMSPPLDMEMLDGRIAYCISKFGMTLQSHGIGLELKGQGVASNALWPATMVESYATINFELGGPALWRKATMLADACPMIVTEDPNTFTGQALIDEDYMRSRGINDFTKYRCDPTTEPPRMSKYGKSEFERGLVHDVTRAKL